MLLKRIEALFVKDGKYSQGHEAYSGVAFVAEEGRHVRAVEVKNGEIASAYLSPYFVHDRFRTQIDITGFTEDCVTDDEDAELSNGSDLAYDMSRGSYDLFFEGKAYSGLAYEFQQENCVSEFGYLDGQLVSKVDWDVAGNLRNLYFEGDVTQFYEWHASGVLKSAQLNRVQHIDGVASSVYRGILQYSEIGALEYLFVDKAFVTYLSTTPSLSPYFPIRDAEALTSLEGAESLTLSGDGVDDQLFNRMCMGGVFRNTSELLVSQTSLLGTDSLIKSLIDNRSLKKLKFQSNKALNLEFVKALKLKQLDVDCDGSP